MRLEAMMSAAEKVRERLLPRAEVERLVGFKRTAIYAKMASGTFPLPLRDPESGSVRWLESEIAAWIAEAAESWPRGGSVAGSDSGEAAKAA